MALWGVSSVVGVPRLMLCLVCRPHTWNGSHCVHDRVAVAGAANGLGLLKGPQGELPRPRTPMTAWVTALAWIAICLWLDLDATSATVGIVIAFALDRRHVVAEENEDEGDDWLLYT